MSKKPDYIKQIQSIQKASVVSLLILAGLVIWKMSAISFQLLLSYLARDGLASRNTTVFVPAAYPTYDIRFIWLVAGTLLIGAIFSYLQVMNLNKKYLASLKSKVVSLRWIEMGISSAIMITAVALLSGITDLAVLKIFEILMILTCYLGYLSEKNNANSKKPVWDWFRVSLVTATLPWLMIIASVVATSFYSPIRLPWYVYALILSLLAGFGGMAATQYKAIKAKDKFKDFDYVEKKYQLLGLAVKLDFGLILLIGLMK